MEKLVDNLEWYKNPKVNNPFLLNGMDKALKRIVKAVNYRKKIVLYGYYDFDGISAISLLLLVLKFLNADVEYFIPDCLDEKHNINSTYIENHIKFLGADLIITVGCGINSISEVELCKRLGMDIIITDWHKCLKEKPRSTVICPNENSCSYPFKYLSASGIAYKLVEALSMYYKMKFTYKYLDLVMLGTISNTNSIKGENLYIVKEGLEALQNTNNHGLKALLHIEKIQNDKINLYDLKKLTKKLSKVTEPTNKINNARILVELFTTTNEDRANQIAKYLKNEIDFNIHNKE
ncbi:delta(24)-sterol C-methyltransferase [Clostridium botulinum]|uniref:DHH family phosphoesterase n=1 Tax=Clostridium botulinum TaxID=1491 RepID=UPI0006A73EF2|nr:DHH family phosphoesterase [Clostridium botulinum]KOM95598.1 delta(24)-sterol C-methyltransferase [Clostridium botulinum]KOM99609.1 delta(24)-sterol C-methyltransferase [Clostridium botulinum]MBY7004432.1 DHH family phosphoesterase [Clostridium botulinum]MCR1147094.1 DHH family phosphoesterase [Clostridium botulinum]NFH94632.1 delta(24)-sterol C-methyltransferase [Clostridium botulinum]